MADFPVITASSDENGATLHAPGAIVAGWRLLRTRTNHDCAECGRAIGAYNFAWYRPFGIWAKGPKGEYLGLCCDWRVHQ